jgi:hypothetical protein
VPKVRRWNVAAPTALAHGEILVSWVKLLDGWLPRRTKVVGIFPAGVIPTPPGQGRVCGTEQCPGFPHMGLEDQEHRRGTEPVRVGALHAMNQSPGLSRSA